MTTCIEGIECKQNILERVFIVAPDRAVFFTLFRKHNRTGSSIVVSKSQYKKRLCLRMKKIKGYSVSEILSEIYENDALKAFIICRVVGLKNYVFRRIVLLRGWLLYWMAQFLCYETSRSVFYRHGINSRSR